VRTLLGLHNPSIRQDGKNLREESLGDVFGFGDLANATVSIGAKARKINNRPQRIIALPRQF
jgi:hypothetical protein